MDIMLECCHYKNDVMLSRDSQEIRIKYYCRYKISNNHTRAYYYRNVSIVDIDEQFSTATVIFKFQGRPQNILPSVYLSLTLRAVYSGGGDRRVPMVLYKHALSIVTVFVDLAHYYSLFQCQIQII